MSDDIPRLTIRIYRVNADGAVVEDRGLRTLKASKSPMTSSTWPPCQCPRHREAS
jgi:hypothetical protein